VSEDKPRDGLWAWIKKHPSIAIGAGLMLASSGLDGAYMTLLMPQHVLIARWTVSFAWLGLVLNFAADGTDLYLSYRIGRLMNTRDTVKQWGAVILLALGLLVAAGYSWYFSYLQLRRVLPAFEVGEVGDVDRTARIIAGFIPALIVILGLEDGLSHFSSKRFLETGEEQPAISELKPDKSEPEPLRCPICGATSGISGKPFLTKEAVSGHMSAHKHSDNGHEPASERVEVEEAQ
jgi:hypothetical protein